MHSRSTSVLVRLTLGAALALAPVALAASQSSQRQSSPSQNSQGQNAQTAPSGPPGQRQAKAGTLTVPITGAIAAQGDQNPSDTVTGTFTIQRFASSSNGIAAIGTLTALVSDTTTTTPINQPIDQTTAAIGESAAPSTRTIVTRVAVPLSSQSASGACSAVQLVLGSQEVGVADQRLTLDQVVLDLTASPETDKALSTLLCSISGALGNTASGAAQPSGNTAGQTGQVVPLLNQLLDLLG